MSSLSDLQAARTAIKIAEFLGSTALLFAIEGALLPHGPTGTPSVISDRADDYNRAARDADTVGQDLKQVARNALPGAWRGATAESAGQAVDALAEEVRGTATVLQRAATTLTSWADDLAAAQAKDRQGHAALVSAKNKLGFLGIEIWHLPAAAHEALDGIQARIDAAQLAQDSGSRTAGTLRELTSKARAEQVNAAGVDPLSAVVLANETNPGGAVDGGDILSQNALDRGAKQLDHMSPAERAAFERLLAQAKSPQEAAYLWKALAAGHSLTDIQAFDAAIHPHGADPVWLASHLTPDLTNGKPGNRSADHTLLTYHGQSFGNLDTQGLDIYDQGNVNDCVAASTVVAQANVDPTVMLKLTTGGTANGNDSPAAFHERLQHMYTSQYVAGQHADGITNVYPKTDAGLGSSGETLLAQHDLNGTTGSHYHYVSLDNTADRQSALSDIQNAVESGKPVPIDVQGGGEAHQMMIVGRDGNRLEIYNPWGYTTWVSDSQFVHNQLGGVTGTQMNSAFALELP
ncbi:MAG: hypothetical protein J2P15_13375 [Micromonosporaceae bacterium]|nr:hypothetical protein [Micromonosporaceae bacterium]